MFPHPCRLLALLAIALASHAAAATDSADAALIQALRRHDYALAMPLAEPLLAKATPTAAERAAIYAWAFARDDLARVDRLSRQWLAAGAAASDALAAGRLALERLDNARAEAMFRQGLALAGANGSAEDKATALAGLGRVAYKRRAFDDARQWLEQALAVFVDGETLVVHGEVLIRLGRTDEAIAAFERAIVLDPLQEKAHYNLGNGYARRNYVELAAHCGARLDDAARLVRNASAAFEAGDYRGARNDALTALARCSEYGRAHAVLAKALEAERFTVDVHRAEYEARFAAATMPDVPGIAQYVSNWATLSPRHRKRVALSLAPWRAFLPVLVAAGASHTIKPLHLKLSEVPHLGTLKDQRINYDSRLWDDVRGAGGFHTVTGIEDVERTIFDRYDTVLHETTHQVHGVLTADQAREIQSLYQRAKVRDEKTHEGFLSRYAGGSVWEYFAEGANAQGSPRRDDYDTRDVVRERLAAIDPDLQALVQRYFRLTDTTANLPVAMVGAGHIALELGDTARALAQYRRAQALAPDDEAVHLALLGGLGIAQQRRPLGPAAADAARRHPTSGAIRAAAAEAQWRGGIPLDEVTRALDGVRAGVNGDDRHLVDLALGAHRWRLGESAAAIAAYDRVLAWQADSPEGLWGKAAALALGARWDEAFAHYERAVRLRTGVVELRADHARDLLRAGRIDAARAQLDAARLLDPAHPVIAALDAWALLAQQDAASAYATATRVLIDAPWCDLAVIARGAALKALGRGQEARDAVAALVARRDARSPPGYVYRRDVASWVSVHELPAVERQLLDGVLAR